MSLANFVADHFQLPVADVFVHLLHEHAELVNDIAACSCSGVLPVPQPHISREFQLELVAGQLSCGELSWQTRCQSVPQSILTPKTHAHPRPARSDDDVDDAKDAADDDDDAMMIVSCHRIC